CLKLEYLDVNLATSNVQNHSSDSDQQQHQHNHHLHEHHNTDKRLKIENIKYFGLEFSSIYINNNNYTNIEDYQGFIQPLESFMFQLLNRFPNFISFKLP